MKITLFALLFLYTLAQANYCVQVVTLDRFNPNRMKPRVKEVLRSFEDARIERRGSYLVLRVGDYPHYSEALRDIDKIQAIYNDAYIRKCDLDPQTIIYPNISQPAKSRAVGYKTSREELPRYQSRRKESAPRYADTMTQKYRQPKPTAAYSDALWSDCQKCFAPIYLEEEEETPHSASVAIASQKSSQSSSAAQKRRKSDDFWIEAANNSSKKQKKRLEVDDEQIYDPNYYPTIEDPILP